MMREKKLYVHRKSNHIHIRIQFRIWLSIFYEQPKSMHVARAAGKHLPFNFIGDFAISQLHDRIE